MATATLRVDDRYEGFPGLAMGGYAGGLLARRLGGTAEVAFRQPVPTGEPLEVRVTGEVARLLLADDVVAEATPAAVDVDPPRSVSLAAAEAATAAYPGHANHPYPACFTCGPDRAPGDGLRVFPGPVGGSVVAAAWTPHERLAGPDGTLPTEYAWAAVDCSTIWPLVEASPPDSRERVVSGRLAVHVEAPLRAGEPHVVAAWPRTPDGSQRPAAAVVTDADGRVLLAAEHTLVATDWGVPLGVDRWGEVPASDGP